MDGFCLMREEMKKRENVWKWSRETRQKCIKKISKSITLIEQTCIINNTVCILSWSLWNCCSQLLRFIGEIHLCNVPDSCVYWTDIMSGLIKWFNRPSASTWLYTRPYYKPFVSGQPVRVYINKKFKSKNKHLFNFMSLSFLISSPPRPLQIHQCITDRRQWWQTCATRQRYPAWWTLALQTAR